MKKMLFAAILFVLSVVLAYSATVNYQPGTSGTSTLNSEVRYFYVSETDGDVNDFTTDEFNIGNAILDRIVVDANGTDAYKLYLYDCSTTYHNVTLWSKTDCNAATPVSEALVLSDAGSTEFRGIPVVGNLKITLADGDDETMNRIEVFVYYRRQ